MLLKSRSRPQKNENVETTSNLHVLPIWSKWLNILKNEALEKSKFFWAKIVLKYWGALLREPNSTKNWHLKYISDVLRYSVETLYPIKLFHHY